MILFQIFVCTFGYARHLEMYLYSVVLMKSTISCIVYTVYISHSVSLYIVKSESIRQDVLHQPGGVMSVRCLEILDRASICKGPISFAMNAEATLDHYSLINSLSINA